MITFFKKCWYFIINRYGQQRNYNQGWVDGWNSCRYRNQIAPGTTEHMTLEKAKALQ